MRSLLRATARLRRLVALAACLGGATVATAPVLGAQAPTTALTVQVRDELGRPVSQATLTATYDTVSVRRITNDSGKVVFTLPRGEVVRVIARRIGFAAGGTRIELGFGDEQASITLRRLSVQTLDTVRVLAQRAVRGLVVSAALQQPIRGASVRILETRSRLETDSTGGFDVPLDAQRNVTLLVSADGFAPVQRIERLDPGASVELLIVLDSANTVPTRLRPRIEDLESRLAWRDPNDATVGSRELRSTGIPTLADALQRTQSANEKGLRLSDDTCIFLNGDPQPGMTLNSFPVESVRLVELYERGGQQAWTLANRWPKGAPCGNASPTVRGPGRVQWAVVWTYW
jgi:hypothetical protein